MKFHSLPIAAAVLATACLAAQAATPRAPDANATAQPTGKGYGVTADGRRITPVIGAEATTTTFGGKIRFHGGPVLNDPNGVNVYYIWYGNWAGNSATTILTDLANGFTGSPWWKINTTYRGPNGVAVANRVNFLGAINDAYSQGTALSDTQIQQVVSNAITGGQLPKDSNAVYFVLTSQDVNATSGFCTNYCGWHNHATIAGADIKYSFVGNPARCPSSCITSQNQTVSPNGNPGADGMASILAHELTEAVTDPDLNAWYDIVGQENADKCAWTFGATTTQPNGSLSNVTIGSRPYLIQRNWAAGSRQGCSAGI